MATSAPVLFRFGHRSGHVSVERHGLLLCRLPWSPLGPLETPVARPAARLRAAIRDDIGAPVMTATTAALATTALSTDPDAARLATSCNPPVAVVNPDA